MRAVIQRVNGASVAVDGEVVGSFTGPGLVALVGINVDDDQSMCATLADKIWKMRIFDRDALTAQGFTVRSENREVAACDAHLPILVISQFTLYADTSRGRRPTWQQAARGDVAEPLINDVIRSLRDLGAHVEKGRFGADMKITQTCDGPVTMCLEI